MQTIAWCSDIHLDAVDEQKMLRFCESIKDLGHNGLVISGDISNAKRNVYHLSVMERVLQMPIYYVRGNHDMWYSSFEDVEKSTKELMKISSQIKCLSHMNYVMLSDNTALVGHDGWYDALHGDWKRSSFVLNDWYNTRDFIGQSMPSIVALCRSRAHEATTHVADAIKAASRYASKIIVCTHVPPFRQVCRYRGNATDENAIPYFSSKIMGDMLMAAAKSYSNKKFVVLCGHTHFRYDQNLLDNLECHVARAEYSEPEVQKYLIEV